MAKPSLPQLTQAHAAANLRGSLTDAMRCPALARCLEITARVLSRPASDSSVSDPATLQPSQRPRSTGPTIARAPLDFKRASAADLDE